MRALFFIDNCSFSPSLTFLNYFPLAEAFRDGASFLSILNSRLFGRKRGRHDDASRDSGGFGTRPRDFRRKFVKIMNIVMFVVGVGRQNNQDRIRGVVELSTPGQRG